MKVYLTQYYFSDCGGMGDYQILGCYYELDKARKQIYKDINERSFGYDITETKVENIIRFETLHLYDTQIYPNGQTWEIIELEVV